MAAHWQPEGRRAPYLPPCGLAAAAFCTHPPNAQQFPLAGSAVADAHNGPCDNVQHLEVEPARSLCSKAHLRHT